jgi:hypothetical protein
MSKLVTSGHGLVTADWADGTYSFRLAHGQIFELQDKLNMGPPELLFRLQSDRWRVEHIAETLRLALIGGGTAPLEALRLMRTYIYERPYRESHGLAVAVVLACLVSPEPIDMREGEPKPGESAAAAGETQSSGASITPSSTETVQ